jgi:hypothetical protein
MFLTQKKQLLRLSALVLAVLVSGGALNATAEDQGQGQSKSK